MKIHRFVLFLSAAFLLSPSTLFAERSVERSVDATADVELEIETLSGQVRLHAWERSEVRVSGTVGDDVTELGLSSYGRRVELEVELPRHTRGRLDADVDLDVWFPKAGSVSAEGVSTSFEVADAAGDLEIQTVSGDITVRGGAARIVDVSSVSGGIAVDGGRRVEAGTVSGAIRLTGISGDLEASSVSGNVEVTATDVQRADLETVSGSIDLDADLAANANLDLSSHSGGVTLSLPADVSAAFDISVFSGSIRNDFGPETGEHRRHGPGTDLAFSTGRGDARVTIDCFSGRVQLRQR